MVLGDRPLVAETPESLLDDDTTPTAKFFIRNNGQIPEPAKDPDSWRITVDGEVNKTLELTLGELKQRFQPVTHRLVLECGGNGRSFFTPTARGNQWTNGGAGCAEWTGVRLADVLRAAGVKARGLHRALRRRPHLSGDTNKPAIFARRADRQGDGREHDDRLGDERRTAAEYPRRAGATDIPGWPGSTSAKWLTRIWVRDRVHDGQGMSGTSYRVTINPIVPGRQAREKNSAIWNRCRCARSSPARPTEPSSPAARANSGCAARPGPAICRCGGSTYRSTTARPGSQPS